MDKLMINNELYHFPGHILGIKDLVDLYPVIRIMYSKIMATFRENNYETIAITSSN